jgi:hypothetical protein
MNIFKLVFQLHPWVSLASRSLGMVHEHILRLTNIVNISNSTIYFIYIVSQCKLLAPNAKKIDCTSITKTSMLMLFRELHLTNPYS